MKVATVILFVVALFPPIKSKKVLLLPSMINSHILELVAIGEGLAKKGHQVVIAMHKGEAIRAHDEIRIIFYGTDAEGGVHLGSYADELMRSLATANRPDSRTFVNTASSVQCHSVLRDTSFHEQLRNMQFDFAIVDGFLPARCLYIIPQKLKIPYASVTAHIPADLVGTMLSLPSIQSNVYFKSRSHKMDFVSRVRNTVEMIFYCIMVTMTFEPSSYHSHHQYRSLADLANQSELWIINIDPFVDDAYPSMPHVVYAGGLTATRNKESMSEGLRTFVENAPNGVIVVSFGSLLPKLPLEIADKFVRVFGKLKQRVVWRSTGHVTNLPANVRIEDWIPQLQLLEHRNTRILISHCGGTGQYEAIYFAIPMIGFPLFTNHEGHARKMVERGVGLRMTVTDFTEEDLERNIQEILANVSYSDNVQRLSQMLRDRPTTLKDTAIYWVDHVIKYGGQHLRSPAVDLDWKQLILLDVTFFLAILMFTFSLIVYIFLSCICRLFWGTKTVNAVVKRRRQLSFSKQKRS